MNEEALLADLGQILPTGRGVEVPRGDDCAVLAVPDGRLAVTTDMLCEDVHFYTRWSSAEDIGWRAAMQNLADVVAMGARPRTCVVGLGVPSTVESSWIVDFGRGFAAACPEGVGVDGGDLTRSDSITVGVTALGDYPQGLAPITRSGASEGHWVYCCGELGWAHCGYQILSACEHAGYVPGRAGVQAWVQTQTEAVAEGVLRAVERFLRPEPPLSAGREVCQSEELSAMMDVSDGLAKDAGRMARASGVHIALESEALRHMAETSGLAVLDGCVLPDGGRLDITAAVIGGGEDHAFLFTSTREISAEHARHAQWPLVRIGRVEAGSGVSLDRQPIGDLGWDHFQSSK